MFRAIAVCIGTFFLVLAIGCASPRSDALASWRDGDARDRIERAVLGPRTLATDAPYLPAAERIAVFDHDGMLIAEQPIYLQYAFVIDRVVERAPDHPEWGDDALLSAAIARDYDAILSTRGALARLTTAAGLDGLTADEYRQLAREWVKGAMHPTLGRPWRECVYQPMLELLRHLEENGFACFIVTGAGADFVRAVAPVLYGLPEHRVIGDPDPVAVEEREGAPVVVRLPLDAAAPYPGKPLLIHRHIGVRPAMAFGAGDGDLPMLEFVAAAGERPADLHPRSHGPFPRLIAVLHHTDAEREFAYDRESRIGRNDRALDIAAERGWVIIDMRRDWAEVFPQR